MRARFRDRGFRLLVRSQQAVHSAAKPLAAVGFVLGLALINQCIVWADESSSTNYMVRETFFGSGGELNACSDAYCSKQSLGEVTVGEATGTAYGAQTGFNTSDIPVLEVTVVGGTFDLGVLAPTTTATASTTVSVRNYLTNGYVVRMYGNPLEQNGHTMAAPAVPTTSQVGTEQFAINLRDNTSPNVGADPVQLPSSSFSFGTYANGYDVVDSFKYVNGDVVAQSDRSSGTTQFTISFIVNIASTTPAGYYETDMSAVVVSTY